MNRKARSNLDRDARRNQRRLHLAVLVVLLILSAVVVVTNTGASELGGSSSVALTEATAQDFSRFPHETQQHKRMPCLVCHVRSEGRTTPKMPGHIPCASCHSQEFAAGNQHPICTICHTATDVKAFPPLRSFNAIFDHGRHLRLTNCATCHKPASRGVALSIPSRANAHVTCFQCHGPRTMVGDKNIGSCSTCHQQGRLVRTSQSAVAFNRNFSHAEHARKGLSCAECHTVKAGVRRGAQVSAPAPLMHSASTGTRSCASCHNSRRAFGESDFSNCRRCHEGRTFKF
jgi:c(7)-type cytochrome triheme protein